MHNYHIKTLFNIIAVFIFSKLDYVKDEILYYLTYSTI